VSILRYSFIVDDFYGIKLSREKLSLVDAHFLGASHHYYRSQSDELAKSRFHQDLFWKHITEMMKIVSGGDFSRAYDNTHRGLDSQVGWNPKYRFFPGQGVPEQRRELFPDPEMFLDMCPDVRFQAGDPHPYDTLLDAPQTKLAQIQLDLALA
jgi:hypothetical protein